MKWNEIKWNEWMKWMDEWTHEWLHEWVTGWMKWTNELMGLWHESTKDWMHDTSQRMAAVLFVFCLWE